MTDSSHSKALLQAAGNRFFPPSNYFTFEKVQGLKRIIFLGLHWLLFPRASKSATDSSLFPYRSFCVCEVRDKIYLTNLVDFRV